MIVNNCKIFIHWRVHETSYAYANREGLEASPRTIGSAVSAVSKMLGSAEEQKVLMQDVVGVSPNNELWATKLSNYWHSISEDIDVSGRELEIGFIYDIDSIEKQPAIELLNSRLEKPLKEDQDIIDYFDTRLAKIKAVRDKAMVASGKLSGLEGEKVAKAATDIYYNMLWAIETERYKFGVPIEVVDYMLYRYCLVYSHVANSFELVTKSPNIRFYLHSESDIKKAKEFKHKLEKDRINTYIKVIQSTSKVENILYAIGKGDTIKSMDETDQFLLLEEISKNDTKRFVSVANDKNLTTRGLIEKYVAYSLLRRLDGSQVIVDSVDPSITIGNNVSEAISFFTNEKNKANVSEYNAKFKGLAK